MTADETGTIVDETGVDELALLWLRGEATVPKLEKKASMKQLYNAGCLLVLASYKMVLCQQLSSSSNHWGKKPRKMTKRAALTSSSWWYNMKPGDIWMS